jgi:mono/diheme cytochrome c family protein
MKRILQRIVLGAGGLLLIGLLVLVTTAQLRWSRTFDAPLPDIRASSDPAIIARGEYLARGPAHCVDCHTAPGGAEMAGGFEWHLPLGIVRSRNITSDPETGIGRRTDAEIARLLRYGVRHDGRAALPLMEFQHLSDEDLVAVISYLRTLEPVHNPVSDHDFNVMGKTVMSFLIRPIGPQTPPAATSPAEGPTLERGAYLANAVANCAGCHSERNPMDGSYTGARLAGGSIWDMESDPTRVFVTPNLTPDARTGHLAGWSEDAFVSRFRAGKRFGDSHMPWGAYNAMSDDDLRAIYRYLMSLDPVENETGPLVQAKAK